MTIKSFLRLLSLPTLLILALGGVLASTPTANASTTPMIINATSTYLCASNASWCPRVIASVPANAQLQVICSRINSYYIEDLANRALEGFVAKSDVRNAPGGLADCDTPAHPAIYAAANALGWMGQIHDVGWCLQFVSDAWTEAGTSIHSAYDAADWWNEYRGKFGYAWDTGGTRFTTPPRGALVFWGTSKNSPYGHVAISVGNGWLVSTEEGAVNTNAVHTLTINQRNNIGYTNSYLGWVMPIPGYQIQQ